MAKTKSKSSGSNKSKNKGLAVRRVLKKDERKTGGFFMRLKTDEWMKAYALFTPDPEADNNPGYYEYFEHYDKSNNSYVPCAGDDCYMCELGDNPSVRALTLWYFPDNPNGEKLKVLKLNGYLIRDFAEIDAEEGGVMGKRFRVKRLSDKGEYRVSPQTDKPLTKSVIKSLLKDALSKDSNENKGGGPIDFEALTLRQLTSALEKNNAVNSLTDADDDDDDDEDEDTPPKSKRGKPAPEEEDDDEDDDDEDEDEDEDESEDDDSDDDEDEEDEDEEDEDEDGDEDGDEDEDEDEDEEEEEESDGEEIKGAKFTVVSADEDAETITVKKDGKNTKLWLGGGVDWNDKVVKGAEITVDAATDEEGDLVIESLKVKAPKAKTGGAKGGKKK